MPKFVTLGDGDCFGYTGTSPEVRDAAHANDAALKRRGAVIGIAGAPVKVRNPDARGVETEDAPFMSAPLPLAGFAIIEAADMAEAIRLVSASPCAVAHGTIEVWPLQE